MSKKDREGKEENLLFLPLKDEAAQLIEPRKEEEEEEEKNTENSASSQLSSSLSGSFPFSHFYDHVFFLTERAVLTETGGEKSDSQQRLQSSKIARLEKPARRQ